MLMYMGKIAETWSVSQKWCVCWIPLKIVRFMLLIVLLSRFTPVTNPDFII